MKRLATSFFISQLLMISEALGQLPGDPGGGGPPVPITGIEILLLAGAGFGIKKLLDKRKS